MRIGGLFEGYGGLTLGVQSVLGGTVAWHSEIDPAASRILEHRWPGVPNLGDITRVDFREVEPVDVLTGGFPCQDVSCAGARRGIAPGTRSGLWAEMARAVEVLRPPLIVIENVRGLLSARAHSELEPCPWCLGDDDDQPALRALGAVLGDLADLGYDAWWTSLRAADVGAPHGRFRVFVYAWPAAAADPSGQRHGSGQDGRGVGRVDDSDAGAARQRQRPRQEESGDRGCPAAADAGGEIVGLRAGLREGGPGGQRRGRPDHDPAPRTAADTHGSGPQGPQPAGRRQLSDGGAVPDAVGGGRVGRAPVPVGGAGRGVAAGRDREGDRAGAAAADADSAGREACGGRPGAGDAGRLQPLVSGDTTWGAYESAVRRWEHLTRPAPPPHSPGAKGAPRLNPAFVEWMMGLPTGWVTDVPGLSRNEQLKALGNGVVPQQAEAATRAFLAWWRAEVAA